MLPQTQHRSAKAEHERGSIPDRANRATAVPHRQGAASTSDGAEGVIYTCPMHPQIRQIGPGNCPICGMALEPVSGATEGGPSPELIDMTRRFWIGTALAVPTVILEMGAHFPGLNLHHYVSPQISIWLQFLLATPVVLWAGWPFLCGVGRQCATDRSICSA